MASTHDSHPTVPNMRAEVVCPSKLTPNNRPIRPKQPLGKLEGTQNGHGGLDMQRYLVRARYELRSTSLGAIGEKQRRRSAENLGPRSAISAIPALALALAEYLEWRWLTEGMSVC
jgi:hypothetical protein